MDTAKVIMELVTALISLILTAFSEKDIKKLKRVTSVLGADDNVLKAKALAALEREKAKAEFEAAAGPNGAK